MKPITSLLFILTFFAGTSYGQTDTGIVYKNLKVKKFYAVSLSADLGDTEDKYMVNDKEVSRKTYRKFEKTWENINSCTPCILRSYDENDILLSEGVAYTDCNVGYFKEFYPNGQIKLSSHYKENPTENWYNIVTRGYCNVPDGQWTYYDENGAVQYSEYWKDGAFIKQVPEQNKREIWRVDLTLNGVPVNEQVLLPNQLKDLVITPRFKNSITEHSDLRVKFSVLAIGRRHLDPSFTLDSFKLFDLNSLLLKNGFTSQDDIAYSLSIWDRDKSIAYFHLNIKADLPMGTETNMATT